MSKNRVNIRQEVRKLADKDTARLSRRFFKTGRGEYGEGDRFLGIRVPVLRRLAQKYKDLDAADIERLLQSPYHEERMLALIMLVNIFKKSDEIGQKHVYDLYLNNTMYINNWDLVDISAAHIAGGYLNGRNRDPIFRLCRSRNLWERRIAVIATFYFIKNRDFEDALTVAERLLGDDEDLIHKAVGWMLREVGNRSRAAEVEFLTKHYKLMPRTMLRYAIEKFPERSRQRYLKGRV